MPNIQYIFKTDDDQNLLNPSFFRTLINILKVSPHHYGGYIVNIHEPYVSQYYRIHNELPKDMIIQTTQYCNGRFYFLSVAAIDALLMPNCCKLIENEKLEDYAIGYHLPYIFKNKILNIYTNKIFKDF